MEVAVVTQGNQGSRRFSKARSASISRFKRFARYLHNCEPLEARTLLSSDVAWSGGVDLPAPLGDAMALGNGYSILLFGGTSTTGATNTVYELDNYSDAWTSQTSLDASRAAGGVGETGQRGPFNASGYKYSSDIFVYGGKRTSPTSSAENYGWTNDEGNITAPSMSTSRDYFAYATDSVSGDLYAIGGLTGTSTVLASAQRYDPVADAWSPIAPLPQALYATAATADGFGHIFVFGGAHTTTGAASNAVYRYTIATNTWDTMSPMSIAVRNAVAVDAPDGRIYLIGGKDASGAVTNVESYNPAADTWSDETPLPTAVYGASAAIDANDNIDVIGGFDSAGAPTTSVFTTPITPGLVMPYTPTIQLDQTYFVYDGQPHDPMAEAIGVDGMTPVDGTLSFTYNGSPTSPTNAGAYNFVATFTSNDSNYLNTAITGELDIAQATPTITVTGGGTIQYDGQPHAISATAAGIDGTTPVGGTFAYTYNGSSNAPVNAGTYTAVASFTSNDPNYGSASGQTTIMIPDPTLPQNVTETVISNNQVELKWDPITIVPVTFNIRRRYVAHSPKGSGATVTYPIIASGLTSTDVFISGTNVSAAAFYVTGVDTLTGVESARVAPTRQVALPPVFSPVTDANGNPLPQQSIYAPTGLATQVELWASGYMAPTYSIQSGPGTMSVDQYTGIVTYTPSLSEAGTTVTPTFAASNPAGTATYNAFSFIVVLPADANHDGVVDTSDFLVMAQNFGAANVGFTGGDFNEDGVVNALDFNLVATNFGAAAPAVASSIAAASTAPASLFGKVQISSLKDVLN
jgi:N-acetylneuraminic acid mutarotase